ncbi:MAG TPA: NAD(P)-dependent oxidoreductase [Kofleriaceae bacterium]|nr:NAD(P)-dependent oxidoreductase [Kofleriaceae bacterium]
MEILFCGSGWLDIVDEIARRLPSTDRIRHWDRRRSLVDELLSAPTDVILPSNGHVDARAIAAAAEHGLRLIQQPAAGTDAIDKAAAAARGIPVCNAPGANQTAVAEAALLLLLLCARRWPAARASFEHGVIGSPLGVELAGSSLLVVGGGKTGSALASRAAALGMNVRMVTSSTTRAELLAALAQADAVSLHVPLSDDTRGMIDAEALAAMQPHAILVNVARGPVIDRDALQDALARGQLGGVGLDVYWQEPWDPADPLYAHPRVVTLPHVAGSTTNAFDGIAAIVVENLTRLKRGDALLHRIA